MPNLETDFEPVPCPLCGADEPSPFVQAFDRRRITQSAFQLVRCGRCSLVYQNPRVRPSSIGKYYSGDYHTSRAGRKDAGAKPVGRERRKCQVIEELGIRPPGTVLDVGCANGDFLLEMRNRGWQVQGVEHSEEASAFCRDERGLQVASGELLARPDDGTRFDLITLWAVLPHFPNPLPTIRHAAGLLSERGRLVLCVANLESWAFKLCRGAWGHLDQPRHYCMFTPETLRRLLGDSGLAMGELRYDDTMWRSQIILPPVARLRKRLNRPRPGLVRKAALKSLTLLNRALANPLEALARARRQGGMIIVPAHRP